MLSHKLVVAHNRTDGSRRVTVSLRAFFQMGTVASLPDWALPGVLDYRCQRHTESPLPGNVMLLDSVVESQ